MVIPQISSSLPRARKICTSFAKVCILGFALHLRGRLSSVTLVLLCAWFVLLDIHRGIDLLTQETTETIARVSLLDTSSYTFVSCIRSYTVTLLVVLVVRSHQSPSVNVFANTRNNRNNTRDERCSSQQQQTRSMEVRLSCQHHQRSVTQGAAETMARMLPRKLLADSNVYGSARLLVVPDIQHDVN